MPNCACISRLARARATDGLCTAARGIAWGLRTSSRPRTSRCSMAGLDSTADHPSRRGCSPSSGERRPTSDNTALHAQQVSLDESVASTWATARAIDIFPDIFPDAGNLRLTRVRPRLLPPSMRESPRGARVFSFCEQVQGNRAPRVVSCSARADPAARKRLVATSAPDRRRFARRSPWQVSGREAP